MLMLNNEFYIVGKSNMFLAILLLKRRIIDAIYGPQGGVIVLDENDCLVYRKPHSEYRGIYLSADNYLSPGWRWLIDPTKHAINITPMEELSKLFQDITDKIGKE